MAIDIDVIQRAIESAGASWRAAETSMTPLDDRLHQLRCGYTPGPNEPSLSEREQPLCCVVQGWGRRKRPTCQVDQTARASSANAAGTRSRGAASVASS